MARRGIASISKAIRPKSQPSPVLSLDAGTGVYTSGAVQFTAANQQSLSRTDAGLPSGNAARSFTGWLKLATPDSSVRNAFGYGTAAPGKLFTVGKTPSNAVFISQFGDSVTSVTTMAAGVWYHVTASYDGTTYTLYVNGVAEASKAMTTNTTPGGALRLGDDPSGGYWDGALDSIGFCPAALTAADAAELYNGGSGMAWGGLSPALRSKFTAGGMYFALDEQSGPRQDATGNGNTLAPSNSELIGPTTRNGGFEAAGSPFAVWSSSTGGASTVNRDTTVLHGGTASCRVDIDANGSQAFIFQNVLVPGSRYNYSFWAKATGPAGVGVGPTDAFYIPLTWTQFSGSFVANSPNLNLASAFGSSVSFYLDDMVLTDLGPTYTPGFVEDIAQDGNPVNKWSDRSGNGNEATQTTLSRQPAYAAAAWFGSPAVHFDGAADYMDLFQGTAAYPDVTYSFWIRPDAAGQHDQLLYGAASSDEVYLSPSNTLSMTTPGGSAFSGSTKVAPGNWVHLVLTVSGTSVVAYYDGAPDGTGTLSGRSAVPSSGARVGADASSGTQYFGGDLGSLAVYPSVLSPAQVASLYAATKKQ